MKFVKTSTIFLTTLLFIGQTAYAQLRYTSEGASLPVGRPGTPETIKVMYIFAEVAVDVDNTCADLILGDEWPMKGIVPLDADQYFDATLPMGGPTSIITKRLFEASFGDYIVLGDYLVDPITIECSEIGNQTNAVLDQLEVLINTGQATFGRGSSLSDFDQWTILDPDPTVFTPTTNILGLPKLNSPNGKIDVLIILYRNHPSGYYSALNGQGLGPAQSIGDIGTFSGCDNQATFGIGPSGPFKSFVLQEYFHGMFGGNEWHTVSGAGPHTFVANPHATGISSQSGTQSLVVNGYERHHMGWKGWKDDALSIRKTKLISIVESGIEFSTDFTTPVSNTSYEFTLRDFVITGDAVRIKLPHINWIADGDVKNQYLWLENHQKLSEYDHSGQESNCEAWIPGMQAYIQVGKDIDGDSPGEVWPGYSPAKFKKPNSLGSYLYPLTAEGNWDFKYRSDLAIAASTPGSEPCRGGATNTPTELAASLENPLTGFSDLFNAFNSNGDDKLRFTGDDYSPGFSKVESGQIVWDLNKVGDLEDAFTSAAGRNLIAMGTNPAPVPVYTFTSKPTGSNPHHNGLSNQEDQSYENREIWLNGLSIEILSETPNTVIGGNDLRVRIKWNERDINNDVRWCGNIKLSANEFGPLVGDLDDPTEYSLNLKTGKTMRVDRGQSPTQHLGVEQIDGEWIFTDPSVFTCLPNSYFHMEPNSTVIVENGSEFRIQQGAKLEVHENCEFIVKSGCKLVLEQGALIDVHNNGIIKIESGAILEYENSDIVLENEGVLEIGGILDIQDNSTFTFQPSLTNGCGFVRFTGGISSAQPNVLGGTNSGFELDMTCGSSKVLEIKDGYLYTDENLGLLRIIDGLIEFRGSFAKLALKSNFIFSYVNFHSTIAAQGQVITFGQQISTVGNCIFNRTSIIAVNFQGTHSLFIDESSIINNASWGLLVWGGGVNLRNVTYRENGVGVIGVAMEEGSVIRNSVFKNNGEYGIQFTSGSGNFVKITDSQIDLNDIGGIYGDDVSLKIKCSSISHNDEFNFGYGINLFNNSLLNMSAINGGGYVQMIGNKITIQSNNSQWLDLNVGFNNLEPTASTGPGFSLRGTVQLPFCSQVLNANNNRWGNLNNSPPGSFYFIDLQSSLNYCQIPVVDVNPGNITLCPIIPPPDPCTLYSGACDHDIILTCATCPTISTSDFVGNDLNDAIGIAISNTELIDDSKDDLVAIDQFHQILTLPLDRSNPDVNLLISLAYSHMKSALGNAFTNAKITEDDNITQYHSSVQQVLDVQDTLMGDSITHSILSTQFYLNLDKAHTNRLAGKRDVAIQILIATDSCELSDKEREYLNQRIALYKTEVSILSGQELIENFAPLLEATGIIDKPVGKNIDTTAVIDGSADIGDGVSIGAGTALGTNVTIGNEVVIEDNVTVGDNVSISAGASIGDNTTIEMNTTVGENTTIKDNVEISKDATLGDNVVIADNVHISKDVVIGDNVVIGEGVFLKKDVEISAGACILSGTRIGMTAIIGTNAIVGADSRLGNNVLIGDESRLESGVSMGNGAETGTGAVITEGTTVGMNASVCDGESTTGDVANNGGVGSCTTPTPPTDPASVLIDCNFAIARARLHQNFFNGFVATNQDGSNVLCSSNTIDFFADLPSATYFWDFGDCATSTERSPSHNYSVPGIYVIRLVQDFNCLSDTLTGAINVFPEPIPSFTVSVPCDTTRLVTLSRAMQINNALIAPFCMDQSLVCTSFAKMDTSRFRIVCNWDFGTTSIPSFQEISTFSEAISGQIKEVVRLYPTRGVFDVSASSTLQLLDLHTLLWNDVACSNTFSKQVVVGKPITVDFTTETVGCLNLPVQFVNLTKDVNEPVSWFWDFDDGQTSTEKSPQNTYAAAGEGDVTLVATDASGCVDSILHDVDVLSPVQANFEFDIHDHYIVFSNTSVNAQSFIWNFGDESVDPEGHAGGEEPESNNPTHVYNLPGTYEVCLAVGNGCFVDTLCQEVIIGTTGAFQKAYGGSATDRGQGIIYTTDGGYVSRGYTNSFGAGNRDAILMKTDAQGNLLWSKVYGGTNLDDAKSVQQTTDGGYILVGRTSSFGNALRKGLIVKTDFEGNVEWSKVFSTPSANISFSVIRELSGGGYMLIGNTDEGSGNGQILLAQLDAQGNKVFAKAIGGSGNRFPRHLELTNDGGYLILGDTRSGTDIDVLIIKTDASGTINWSRTYSGLLVDFGQSSKEIEVLGANGGGFVISGRTNSQGAGGNDGMMFKVDEFGNLLWAKTYGGSGSENFSTVKEEAGTHNLLSCGITTSFGSGAMDVYLVKTDNLGNLIESKTFGGTGNDNSVGNDDSFQFTPDGGVVISAATSSFGSGGDDMYIIKTDASGSSGCNEVTPVATQVANATVVVNAVTLPVTSTSLNAVSHTLSVSSPALVETTICPLPQAKMGNTGGGKEVVSSVETPEIIGDPESYIRSYPNPFSDRTTIEFSMSSTEKTTVEIHSISGERVALLFDAVAVEGSTYKVDLVADQLSGGIYFYTLRSSNERITKKLVVIK